MEDMESVSGARVLAWLVRDHAARAPQLIGCLFDDGRSDHAWEIQAWDNGRFYIQSEVGNGPVRSVRESVLDSGNIEIPALRRDLIRAIQAAPSATWETVVTLYANRFRLGDITEERRATIRGKMQATLTAFDPEAVKKAEGIDPQVVLNWCLLAHNLVNRKAVSHETIRQTSDEFAARGWHRSRANLHEFAWGIYRRPWDLFWALSAWADTGDAGKGVDLYGRLAGVQLGDNRVEAAIHSKGGWLLRDLGRLDEARRAAFASWDLEETPFAARLMAAIERDVKNPTEADRWTEEADRLDRLNRAQLAWSAQP